MGMYTIEWDKVIRMSIEVEADSEEEAMKLAYNEDGAIMEMDADDVNYEIVKSPDDEDEDADND